jgi:hypothetical protein
MLLAEYPDILIAQADLANVYWGKDLMKNGIEALNTVLGKEPSDH